MRHEMITVTYGRNLEYINQSSGDSRRNTSLVKKCRRPVSKDVVTVNPVKRQPIWRSLERRMCVYLFGPMILVSHSRILFRALTTHKA